MDSRKVASVCLACSSAVGSTVITMVVPSIDPALGVPILAACGIGFLVAGAIWCWPQRMKLILLAAGGALVLVGTGAAAAAYVRSKGVQDYVLSLKFDERERSARLPVIVAAGGVAEATWTGDGAAVCLFRTAPVIGFVSELLEAHCA